MFNVSMFTADSDLLPLMTKLYGYDRNDDGIMLNKRIY